MVTEPLTNQRYVYLKKRKQAHNLEFYIGDEKLEIVDNFTYLGINFTHTGNFKNAVKVLSDQALRAYQNLLYILTN